MFREMRQKRQLLSKEDTQKVLYQGTSGVLAVSGDDDYPYAVPLSYVYDGHKIYFHGAKAGHKLDSIVKNPYFRSVIVFGTIRILHDEAEKREAIEKFAVKYAPDDTEENRNKAIEGGWNPLCVLEMTPEHISGKEAIGLVKQHK